MIDFIGYYALAMVGSIIAFQFFVFKVVIIDGSMYFLKGKLKNLAVMVILILSPFFVLIAFFEMQPYRISFEIYRRR